MADFLSRLSERTLSLSEVTRPRVAPLFAAGQDLAADEDEQNVRLDEDEPEAPDLRVTPRQATRVSVTLADDYSSSLISEPPAQASPDRPEAQTQSDGPQPATAAAPSPRILRPRVPPSEMRQPQAESEAEGPASVPPGLVARRQDFATSNDARRSSDLVQTPVRPLAMAPESLADTRGMPAAPALQPTVRVTIGRIDVRAVFPTTEAPPPAVEPAPSLSLADYLKQRREGLR